MGAVAFVFIGLSIVAAEPGIKPGIFAYSPIFAAFAYTFWLVGGSSAVRAGSNGVVVDNLLRRHAIPWSELSDVALGNGLELKLRNGETVHSIMYGGSIAGSVAGYPNIRPVVERLRTMHMDALSASLERNDGAQYESSIHFSIWPPLIIVVAVEVLAAILLSSPGGASYVGDVSPTSPITPPADQRKVHTGQVGRPVISEREQNAQQ
jgi:Bacterial PH domain